MMASRSKDCEAFAPDTAFDPSGDTAIPTIWPLWPSKDDLLKLRNAVCLEHRYRRVIPVDLVTGHQVAAQLFDQWREQPARFPHPVRQCRANQPPSFA